MRFANPKQLVEEFEDVVKIVNNLFAEGNEIIIHSDSVGNRFTIINSKYAFLVESDNVELPCSIVEISELQQPFTILAFTTSVGLE